MGSPYRLGDSLMGRVRAHRPRVHHPLDPGSPLNGPTTSDVIQPE